MPMDTRTVVEKYFEYANAGRWDDWTDQFAENTVVDEQLAGRVEGRETLRPLARGLGTAYKKFVNTPLHIVVEGNRAAAKSHISAAAAKYPEEPIEADAVNYFEVENGVITYMSNHHDSKPFEPFLRQLAEDN